MMRQFMRIAVAALCLLASIAAEAQEPQRRALLVGINNYQADFVRDLNGTQNDVSAMHALLVNRYGFNPENVTVLRDSEATHAAIVAAIRTRLTEPSRDGDIAVFYFSGHGSQMIDVNDDESDGWDETLVAADSRMPGIFDVSDDELNAAFAALAARTPNITIMLDSCHSGTAVRDVATARRIPADTRTPPSAQASGPRARSTEGSDELLALGANYALISGSRAEELSNEDRFDGRIQGALTYFFVQAAQTDRDGTYRAFFPLVASRVSARFPAQTPQLEGTGLDSRIFGLRDAPGAAWLRVESEDGNRGRVLAGTPYGLRVGAVLSVYADGAPALPGPALGTLTIDQAGLDASSGTWRGARALPAQARARIDKLPYDGRARGVWLAQALPGAASETERSILPQALRDAIRDDIDEYPSLTLLPAVGEADAEFRILALDGRFAILSRDGSVLTNSVVVGAIDAAPRLLKQLHDWARWQSLDALRNPDSALQVGLTVRLVGTPADSPAPTSVPDGSAVRVEIENRSSERLFYALLNLSVDGLVKLLHPAPGAQDTLAPGGKLTRTYRLSSPASRAVVTDTFKVIASTQPVAGELFAQDAIRATLSEDTPLKRMLAARATATPREAFAFDTSDWTTAQRALHVMREAPILGTPRIALHFAAARDPDAVVDALSAGARSICPGDRGADCATARALSRDGTVIEVTAPTLAAQRDVGGGQRTPSIGQAFEDAYRAGESAGAEYAEPLLEVRMPGDEDFTGTRGGDGPPDPVASADDRWSLRYTAVPQAWELLRDASGRAAGSEAQGVFVAHPDTGYTQHPENWNGATPRAIDSEHGHDYFDDDNDATDPLLDNGLVANPGHGTGSGSVIVSPPDCQLQGVTKCVSGTAPGARLMPLRVNTSVVVFDTSRLARAIEDGASGRWGQKADLVSIAMGGPPSRTLHKAVKSAVAQGTLVVAAAGNYVRIVVWPARFTETVAISAINPRCEPWKHASHGGAVDFAAPGEAVWRASTSPPAQTGGAQLFAIGTGDGTTFATGTTAGIAALWIARHRDEPAFTTLRSQGAIADAFRASVARTAWRPGDAARPPPAGVTCATTRRWRADEYGAGVIDARALLADALPGGSPRDLTPDVLPLFTSLYDAGDRARAEADYRALFAGAPLAQVAQFETEILFHYTASDEVRDALERQIAGTPFGAQDVRRALRTQDLSPRLRASLTGP